MTDKLESRKAAARQWFEKLRDEICASFESIEHEAIGENIFAEMTPGSFEQKVLDPSNARRGYRPRWRWCYVRNAGPGI